MRVVGAHIAAIGTLGDLAAAFPNETLWPARGRVLMPGFVNTHAHLARHLARGLALRTAREWGRYDRALSAEDVSWAVKAALVEGVRHGVTTVVDFHRSGACLDLSLSEVIGAADRVGVRVATCYGAAEDDTPLERRAAIDECVGFARELERSGAAGCAACWACRRPALRGIETLLAEAMESAGGLAVHVDLALDLTPAERWTRAGLLPGTALPALWAHAERAPRNLVGAVRERGDALCATGSGAAVALVRETEVAWGSDDGANAPPLPDGSLHRAWPTRTTGGCSWPARAGRRTTSARSWAYPARRARRPDPRRLPARDRALHAHAAGAHLWNGLLRAPVAGVMVAGNVVMDNGVLVSVDETEVAARARECAAARLGARRVVRAA